MDFPYGAAQCYRERLLEDPYRPTYHFAVPSGNAWPGDPNGAFFADGVYHLMYLYFNPDAQTYCWGHISSHDLLHWRSHPDALTGLKGDQGCFSGGAFVDDDQTAYLSFWKFPSKDFQTDNGGIALACARPPYDHWERMEPIAIEGKREEWGIVDVVVSQNVRHVGCADPSNIWKQDGYYYMQTGNKCVLDAYGRGEDSDPFYRGDWCDLFRSDDLRRWTYVDRFYQRMQGEDCPDDSEDDMCPSFLPLPDRASGGQLTKNYLQLFISHNHGGQYYVGTRAGERFIPHSHGRFSWQDRTCFAPEALLDDKNRQLAWFWLVDNPHDDMERFGWSGVYSFPRSFWAEEGELRMAPAEELDALEHHRRVFEPGTVEGERLLPTANGEVFRLKAAISMEGASRAGFRVRAMQDGTEYTDIYYDHSAGRLVFDAGHSGSDGFCIREEAPFMLREGEKLSLDVFVDKSVIEVYANERQAICRRVYPTKPHEAVGICALSDGAQFERICYSEMAPTNMY